MCCFSGPVQSVYGTRIFARLSAPGRQVLCYQMNYASVNPNAMILPIPAKVGADESSIRFIDLSLYEHFFSDMVKGFPMQRSRFAAPGGVGKSVETAAVIKVHEVGQFVASFVPQVQDFDRLDPRFSIPTSTWSKIPTYADYSFVVFQLKELEGTTHPMAFEFETRHADQIFFPTVHIHDGEVHPDEHFDHQLYCQHPNFDKASNRRYTGRIDSNTGLTRSDRNAGKFMGLEKADNIVDGELAVHRKTMEGQFQNTDVILQPQLATPLSFNRLPDWKWIPAASTLVPLAWILKRRMDLSKKGEANPFSNR